MSRSSPFSRCDGWTLFPAFMARILPVLLPAFLLLASWLSPAAAMRPDHIAKLRSETVDMFYHGFDNYMRVAFPEDELRPVSCTPLFRDQQNPRNIELNDVLGNYSLTLIDSLSTLAILASAPPDSHDTGPQALADFQDGIAALVEQYGDGRPGPSGQGLRARGFDLDSKVQVFETVIRGVGGLISAHLFAVGELPIAGYHPGQHGGVLDAHPIVWPNGFQYDGQLLRLALDLSQRLLPAFYTTTGLPYPRVNLRHGIPFYVNSPLHGLPPPGEPRVVEGPPERTETCSAGAGSLVLEFTVLSRLTGDQRFEQTAKRAFWAVWERRSDIGLIGAGVDAEGGQWIGSYAGIGAGADSFFEYALKTHILLSGHELPNNTRPRPSRSPGWLDPNDIYTPLTMEENSADTFLQAWQDAHAAIKRHLYTGTHHPHYINANLATGSPLAYWIDSLGAYYSGLLTLAGELDEAIETNLLYTALWTRFSALPERWSIRDNTVEGGLGWWPGRPEFIESTYYLYRATKDPWYLYVGEMVLRDITRRCHADCGWAGLQDVRTGQQNDRMESFFLGETAKYMYLLFDEGHPLNSLDAAFVFTTEGHPLIIPPRRRVGDGRRRNKSRDDDTTDMLASEDNDNTCPVPPPFVPLTGSAIASRSDIFHASRLIGLHNIPNIHAGPRDMETPLDDDAASHKTKNHSFFPWTLPQAMLPMNGTSSLPPTPFTLLIEFPADNQQNVGSAMNYMFGGNSLSRLGHEGVLIRSLSGLKVTLLQEEPPENAVKSRQWRVINVGGVNLGRDEKVFLTRETLGDLSDPLFSRVRETVLVDVVFQLHDGVVPHPTHSENSTEGHSDGIYDGLDEEGIPLEVFVEDEDTAQGLAEKYKSVIGSLFRALREPMPTAEVIEAGGGSSSDVRSASAANQQLHSDVLYRYMNTLGVTPTGIGAGTIPDVREAPSLLAREISGAEDHAPFEWVSIYAAGFGCDSRLPDSAARDHQVILIRRGGCSFSKKLRNVPAFTPGVNSLQMVFIVSEDYEVDPESGLTRLLFPGQTRPLLDEVQYTSSGIPRRTPISMLMVHGGDGMYDLLASAASIGIRRRYRIENQGLVIDNLIIL